ncbi:DUF5685 family protein [Nakamurella endophytica]|uniref:Regulatory protein n=1 Tax=Nakamurella endophytica TaxID=1748367 RepID=A0A917SNG3_9ACTN|nr:DUF5685 family protein [Nakamurella endophytica]GGL88391.1 hypothetical protein GCM10011594_05040 [Nakamurella endophytica]
MPVMFGMVHACRNTLDDELLRTWQAHLCGLCLTLRDRSGQLSRAVTNTDAVLVSVLVEAQIPGPARRVTAGPCALRGMQRAAVVAPDDAASRLAATTSLTLAAAKAADVVAEQRLGLAAAAPWRYRAADRLAGPLRRKALADTDMADVLRAVDMLEDLANQGAVERAVEPGDALATVTRSAAEAAGRVFSAAATVAGVPANAEPLEQAGRAFGELAHLLDAVTDLDRDRTAGDWNPVLATGVGLDVVRRRCFHLARRIRAELARVQLEDDRLVRALLVDSVHAAVHRAFPDPSERTAACPVRPTDTAPPETPADPGAPGTGPDAAPDTDPDAAPPADPDAPGPVTIPGPGDPGYRSPRSFVARILPWIGVYCTGYACCASHVNPCTDRRHDAGCSGCSGCDDCSGCGDCCNCCDCCDGCDCNC